MAHACDSNCSRRDLFKKGGFGLLTGFFGLSLASRIFMEEAYGVTPVNPLYDAVIQIFYEGGPSQTDNWDPKPNGTAGTEVFPVLPALGTDIYGQPFSTTDRLPQLNTLCGSDPAIKLGIIRSMTHGNGDHGTAQEWMNNYWQNQRAILFPSTACSMAYLLQGVSPLGIPSVVINSSTGNEVNSAKGTDCPTALSADTNNTSALFVSPTGADTARYARRKTLTDTFNATYVNTRPDQAAKTWNSAVQTAYTLTTQGAAAAAFSLSGKTILPGGATANGGDLQNLTLAQELVKAGIPYVALGIGGNDSHTNNMATITQNWHDTTDPALAKMASNLKAAGKRVLIIMGGEFGRGPADTIGGRDGRDHWPDAFSWAVLSVNQPKFSKNVAVGDTGVNGTNGPTSGLKDPIYPGVLGALVYRSMGFPIGTNPAYNVPTAVGPDCPVDLTMATSASVDQGTWLMQQFGLA